MNSAWLCRIEADVGAIETLGVMASGERRVVAITGGTVSSQTPPAGNAGDPLGIELEGKLLSGGADWQWVRSDGITEIAAHYVIETSLGERIEVQSNGYRHGPPEVMRRLAAGESVAGHEYYFRTAVTFRTASSRPQLRRLNGLLAIAVGERRSRAVLLDIYPVL